MKVTIYSLKPHYNLENHFIDIPNQPTFDPKHPTIYPGNEVEVVETLPGKKAQIKYGRMIDEPYLVHNSGSKNISVTILRLTGLTSADII